MKKTLFCVALVASLAGCAGAPAPQATSAPAQDAEYAQLVTQAENEIKLAAKTGHLWRDTEKFLEESKAAMNAGDKTKAMSLARKALAQARGAQQQARDNANPKTMF
jgi:flagellar basal body L-ring protein FlgH